MITFTGYTSFKNDLLKGTIDFANDDIYVALVTSDYTFSAGHDFFDDITNELSTGGGYTEDGKQLTTPSITNGVFTADPTMWASATFTCRGAVVYKKASTPETSPLIGFIDFDEDQEPADQTFRIVWDNAGMVGINFA
jgi:hypothetical protein